MEIVFVPTYNAPPNPIAGRTTLLFMNLEHSIFTTLEDDK